MTGVNEVEDQTIAPAPVSGNAPAGFAEGRRLRVSAPGYLELLDFLWEEAAVLDRDDLSGWKTLLDEAVVYRMPVCVTRRRNVPGYKTAAMHFDENFGSLCFRIRRIEDTVAWSTDPPPRARRFVTGVRAWLTSRPDVFDVASSLLLVRSSDDDYRTDVLTAERFDRLRRVADGSIRLLSREIVADQSTIPTHNLAVFL